MMIEANSQLGLVQLPREIFGEYEGLIKMTHYEMFRKQLGEDPIKAYKRKLISEQNQKERGVYLQLKDGTVPSFEEFKSIKEQIVKDQNNPHSDSPLTQQEKHE